MKGQAINLDWTIGLALFLLTVLAGTFTVVTQDFGSGEQQAQRKALLVNQELEDEASIQGRTTGLYTRGPVETGKIPVDTSYVFAEEGYAGSGKMELPADIRLNRDRIITVTGTGNSTHDLAYFLENVSNVTYSNQVTVDNDTGLIENQQVSVNVGSPGVTSMEINGNEVLNDTADLEAANYTVEEDMIHASSLNSSLKLYNGTRELIFEPGNGTFRIKNLTDLYWHGEGVQNLDSSGVYRNGQTRGFTVASGYGVTFLGDLDAKVELVDGKVVADINSSRLRIFLHNSGYDAGKKRINYSVKGDVFFGAEKPAEGVWDPKLDELEELNRREFGNRLELRNWEYNITLKNMKRGSRIPYRDVVVRQSRATQIFRNGSYTGIDDRVALWR